MASPSPVGDWSLCGAHACLPIDHTGPHVFMNRGEYESPNSQTPHLPTNTLIPVLQSGPQTSQSSPLAPSNCVWSFLMDITAGLHCYVFMPSRDHSLLLPGPHDQVPRWNVPPCMPFGDVCFTQWNAQGHTLHFSDLNSSRFAHSHCVSL